MKTVDLTGPFRGLDGSEIAGQEPIGKQIADVIAKHFDPKIQIPVLKVFEWSQELWRTQKLCLSTDDMRMFESLISSLPISYLARGRVLEAVENAKTVQP